MIRLKIKNALKEILQQVQDERGKIHRVNLTGNAIDYKALNLTDNLMKKTIILLTTLFIQPIIGMELTTSFSPSHHDVKMLIVREYFSHAHEYLEECAQGKISPRQLYGYLIMNISLIDQAFFACANDKDTTKILTKSLLRYPNFNLSGLSTYKMPGIVNYMQKSEALVKFIATTTTLSFCDKIEPEAITLANQTIKELVFSGADTDLPLDYDETCLHITTKLNYYGYTQQLLECGANPNLSSLHSFPLHHAITNGKIEMIKLLFKFGAHNECLEHAVDIENLEIIKLLINRPDMSLDQLEKGIAVAHRQNDPNILKLLTDAKERIMVLAADNTQPSS